MLQGKAAGRTAGVQHQSALGDDGQFGVTLFPGDLLLRQTAADAVQQGFILQELQSQGLGGGRHGDVIRRGPQAPRDDDKLGPAQGLLQSLLKHRRPVPQYSDTLDRKPHFVQPAGGITGIEISHPARDQLRAGGDDFPLHLKHLLSFAGEGQGPEVPALPRAPSQPA